MGIRCASVTSVIIRIDRMLRAGSIGIAHEDEAGPVMGMANG